MTPEERARVLAAMDRASYGFVAGGAMNLHEAMLTAAYPLIREAVLREGWEPISNAKTDGTEYWVYAPGAAYDLPDIQCRCAYHPDAGWCVDELREVTHFRLLPAPPAGGRDGE